MDLQVLPLHKHPEYLMACCKLINGEWTRSETARLRSLEGSCDTLPTCLILIELKKVIGHCRLSAIPSKKNACFIESVVIDKDLRGKGYGRHLMLNAENFCKDSLNLSEIYLSTNGQEGFYAKLGYTECMPVSIYGTFNGVPPTYKACPVNSSNTNVPVPPPIPQIIIKENKKIFMNKIL